jgi:hypothetical protein
MERSKNRPSDQEPGRRKFFSGMRGLLAAIVLIALGLGWLAYEHRRAERRTILVAELARSGTLSRLDEPTVVGQVVKKFWPRREAWMRDRIGGGWFDHPSIFVCFNLHDEQVPGIVQRLRELGTVKEVHYHGDQLTEAGISGLRAGLPEVNVVPNASPALHRYFLASVGMHVAYGAMFFTIGVAILLLALLVLAIRWLARRLRATGPALTRVERSPS